MRKDERERALEPAQHAQRARDEVTGRLARGVGAGDQVHSDLGVGVAGEVDSVVLEFGRSGGEVLDDAVVHDATVLPASRCGCALRSVGLPCVAHRV